MATKKKSASTKLKQTKSVKAEIKSKNNLKFAIVASIIVLFGAIGSYFVFFGKAEVPVTVVPDPPTVYMSPTTQSLAINTEFIVEVRESSGASPVNAVQANISYPVDKFDFVAADFSTSAFGVEAEKKVDTALGTINIGRGTSGGTSVLDDQLVGKLTFRSKAAGGAGAINFTSNTALVSATDNVSLLAATTPLGNATYTVNAEVVAPHVSITTPLNNSVVGSKGNVAVAATATSSVGISKMEVYVDGALKYSVNGSVVSYRLNSKKLAKGAHNIRVVAYDQAGLSGESSVTITK